MGFQTPLTKIFDFTYQASFSNGLTEHEFDHVFIGHYNAAIVPNVKEVNDYAFQTMESVQEAINQKDGRYTAWFEIVFPKMMEWWQANHSTNLA